MGPNQKIEAYVGGFSFAVVLLVLFQVKALAEPIVR